MRHSTTTLSGANVMVAAVSMSSCGWMRSSGCSRFSATAICMAPASPSICSSCAMRAGVLPGLVRMTSRSCACTACASACRPWSGPAPRCQGPASFACTENSFASCQAMPSRAQASCSVDTLGRTSSASVHSRAASQGAMPQRSGSPVASTTQHFPASRAAPIQPGTALSWPVRSCVVAPGLNWLSNSASVRGAPTITSAVRMCASAVGVRLAGPSSSTPMMRQGLGSVMEKSRNENRKRHLPCPVQSGCQSG